MRARAAPPSLSGRTTTLGVVVAKSNFEEWIEQVAFNGLNDRERSHPALCPFHRVVGECPLPLRRRKRSGRGGNSQDSAEDGIEFVEGERVGHGEDADDHGFTLRRTALRISRLNGADRLIPSGYLADIPPDHPASWRSPNTGPPFSFHDMTISARKFRYPVETAGDRALQKTTHRIDLTEETNVNINLSTPICGRSVMRRCPFRVSMNIAFSAIAAVSAASTAWAQQAEGIVVVSNRTNDTILTSGANGPAGHVDGSWEFLPSYYPCGIDGTECRTNPDGSPPALLGPGQTMGFASVLQSGVASGTGGTLALADYSKSEAIGYFTWSVPWCAFHGCGSCDSHITPAPGNTFAPIVTGGQLPVFGMGPHSCSFGYEITNGQVGSTSQGLMTSGQALSRGTSLNKVSSTDGRYTLQLQTDGNLALVDSGANPPQPLWTAGTANTAASVALMQSDGNFVLYDQNVNVIWASNTANNPGAYLTVEDGFLLIHASNGATLKNLGSDQDLYAGIWQKVPSVPWVAKHGMTAAQYQQEFDTLLAQGYRPVVVSGYSLLDQPVYAAIWEKRASVPWVARHGMTSAQYQQEFDTLAGQGYRPVWVCGYNVAGQDLYAAIFEKPELNLPWVAKHGMTASEYQQQFDALVGQGYRLEEVSGYSIAGQARYAAIWDKPPLSVPWVARHGMTPTEYQQQFNTLTGHGYRLVQVSGYSVAGQTLYAAIWEQSPGAPWVARDGLTSAQYQQEFDQLLSQGYRLTDVSGYNVP